MGNKLVLILGVIAAIVFTYIIMLAMQSATDVIISAANASTGNWSVTPEFGMAQGVINSFPLWQWLLPGFIGLFLIVVIWKQP